ncbi:MAG: beta-mannanase [Verrucomicrobia bacterium]|nr:beta-mannanase [Verrucomicrobiota bacterium]
MKRFLLAVCALALQLGLSGCPGPALPPRVEVPKPSQLVIPKSGAYCGAYVDFGEREDAVTLEAIEGFEKMVGKQQAIVASSSYWGEQSFPLENLKLIARHGSLPLVFWSPWDRPYEQKRGPDKYSLTSIIEGQHDAYIDMWGDRAKEYGMPFIVSFANEANGTWFPWSGIFYGGARRIPGSEPPRYEGPETFKKAYRHVVDRVRARGAKNVQWVFHTMNYPYPFDLWNLQKEYYPGSDYADWVGCSVYGPQFKNDDFGPFEPLLKWPYEVITAIDPSKPFMVVEWGVAELPTKGDRSKWIREAFATMSSERYPKLKAMVFWHERWQNKDGSYSNLRVNSSPGALEAFREGIKSPYWLERPVWQ